MHKHRQSYLAIRQHILVTSWVYMKKDYSRVLKPNSGDSVTNLKGPSYLYGTAQSTLGFDLLYVHNGIMEKISYLPTELSHTALLLLC